MTLKRSMDWDERAFRALVRAFAPMPPEIREKTLQRVINKTEEYVRSLGIERVEPKHVHKVSKEILKSKAGYMYESLVNSFKAEGLEIGED